MRRGDLCGGKTDGRFSSAVEVWVLTAVSTFGNAFALAVRGCVPALNGGTAGRAVNNDMTGKLFRGVGGQLPNRL